MSIHSRRRIDRQAAEQLLGAPSAGASTSHPQLAALLTAAAAPGRPHELSSEEATVSAFRAARHATVPRPRGLSVVKKVAMKALTVKALAVLGTTTVGGVALAATTGALPNPLTQPSHTISSGLSPADPTATRAPAASTPGSRTAASADSSSASDDRDPSRTPSPKLLALCRAYQVGDKVSHGKALDSPMFKELITAAGGKDKVPPYCQALLASPSWINDGGRDPGRGQYGGHDKDGRTTPRPSLAPGR